MINIFTKINYHTKIIIGRIQSLFAIKSECSDFAKLEELLKTPRYTRGHLSLSKYELDYVDGASLYHQYREIVNKKIYIFSDNKEKNYTILDCGANIGLASIELSRNYPNSKIIAFEPDPEIFEVLKKNTKKISNIKINNCAIWTSAGETEFNSSPSDAGSMSAQTENSKKIKVRTEDIKKYLDEKIDFLKIDIEGAEYEVIKAAENKLHNVYNIFVEYHCDDLKNNKFAEMVNILSKNNFNYYLSPENVPASPFTNKRKPGFYYQINIFGFK